MKIAFIIYIIGICIWYIYESITVRKYINDINHWRFIPLVPDNKKVFFHSVIWPFTLITSIIDNFMEDEN